MSGDIMVSSDLYGAAGVGAPPRLVVARLAHAPLTFLGEFTVGLDILLSSEGNQLRRNVSQFGLNPRYKWVTLHIGDFGRGYSSYSVQGMRVRGARTGPATRHLPAVGAGRAGPARRGR